MHYLLYRARRKFFNSFPSRFNPYTIQARAAGEQFDFYIGTFESSHWYGKHRDHLVQYIDVELRHIKQFIRPGEIIADVGAHHGFYSLFFSRCVGKSGRVYAFECLPFNFEILARNINLNGVRHIVANSYVIGAHRDIVSIANDSSGVLLSPKEKRVVKVPQISLDEYFDGKAECPTMLKIDVEGYEWEVFQGCKQIFQNKPKIILELHSFAHGNPSYLVEKNLEFFCDYKNMLWQESAYSEVRKFEFTKQGLSDLARQPNPRLYLIP